MTSLVLLLATAAFATEDPEITVHLLEVVDTLRAETPTDLPAPARARRLALLDALEGYAVAGDFPEHAGRRARGRAEVPPRSFQGHGERAPVFVDVQGTHCAVGYLLALERPEVAARVAAQDNDGWLPDMRVEGLADWAWEAGFTLDELAWIQPSYLEELPFCDDLDLSRIPPGSLEGPPAGPSLRVLRGDERWCLETCEGPVQVWQAFENASEIAAEDVRLEAVYLEPTDGNPQTAPDGIAMTAIDGLLIPAGETKWLGPLVITDPYAWVNAFRVRAVWSLDTVPQDDAIVLGLGGDFTTWRGADCELALTPGEEGAETYASPEDFATISPPEAEAGCGCDVRGLGGLGGVWLLPWAARRRRR